LGIGWTQGYISLANHVHFDLRKRRRTMARGILEHEGQGKKGTVRPKELDAGLPVRHEVVCGRFRVVVR